MSRIITPCDGIPGPGGTMTLPFPDLAKPIPGGWLVTARLRSTTSPPAETVMQVIQGGKIVASTTFTPTTSFADYSLTVSGTDLASGSGDSSNVSQGSCSVSGPVVVISDRLYDCCTPPVALPGSIHVSVSASGLMSPVNGMILEVPIVGAVTIPVCENLSFNITTDQLHPFCDPEYLAGAAVQIFNAGVTNSIHTSLSCGFFQGTPLPIGPVNTQYDCDGVEQPGITGSVSVVYSL